MKKFNSSALTHKRAEVMKAARDGGAVIQLKETNGDIREEFVLTRLDVKFMGNLAGVDVYSNGDYILNGVKLTDTEKRDHIADFGYAGTYSFRPAG